MITDFSEYDRFFNVAPDLLCIAGFDGYFKELNPAWEKVLGFTTDELKAKPFIEFIHPKDQEATDAETRKLTTGEDSIRFENRYLCKDGSYKWLSWSATASPEQGLFYAVVRTISEGRPVEPRGTPDSETAISEPTASSPEQYLLHTLMENTPDHLYFQRHREPIHQNQ